MRFNLFRVDPTRSQSDIDASKRPFVSLMATLALHPASCKMHPIICGSGQGLHHSFIWTLWPFVFLYSELKICQLFFLVSAYIRNERPISTKRGSNCFQFSSEYSFGLSFNLLFDGMCKFHRLYTLDHQMPRSIAVSTFFLLTQRERESCMHLRAPILLGN